MTSDKQLLQKLIEYLVSVAPEFQSLKKKEQKNAIKQLEKVLSTSSHEVHLGTGWPLSLHSEEITTSIDSTTGKNIQGCKETFLEIILDEEN